MGKYDNEQLSCLSILFGVAIWMYLRENSSGAKCRVTVESEWKVG